ncbi:thioredoxin domain-containing protein [Aureliella helgolandensis]|uniref:Thioredoxin n=1 Tax=Aureliella helgolandensis TaxID=2527968 RepID=A0A518GF69_9BACT|nr:thioredoxin domain-containing protein [Aureliella helgolandensis]QDV27239.1 Thioredoxin [Aureliella helgolandensis]
MAGWLLAAVMVAVTGGNSDCAIVQFTATWCEPCQQVQPALQQLQQDGWTVYSVDTDQQPEVVKQYSVDSLPTLIILSSGREVDRIVGAAAYEVIQQRVQRVAARNQSTQALPAPAPQQPIVRGQSPSTSSFPLLSSVANAGFSASNPASPRELAPAAPPPHTPQVSPASFSGTPVAVENASFSRDAAPPQAVASTPSARTSLSPEQAIRRAAQATVRIRVDEANSTAYGTGTIVDLHGSEALVLTCGHLFREMTPGSQLTVDLFAGTPQEINLPALLIDFKAEGDDIGLLTFRTPVALDPVELLPRGTKLNIGQDAFSFGCDHGSDPTRRDTKIKNINRYIGAANVEIFGAPAVGRSGGGLFDTQGRLIGVCNAADAADDEGIYAAADVVYAQIERLGLTHLFEAQTQGTPTVLATSSGSPVVQAASFSDTPAPTVSPRPAANLPDLTTPLASSPSGQQMICIVRDGTGQDQVLTINSPSPQLLDAIRAQGNR